MHRYLILSLVLVVSSCQAKKNSNAHKQTIHLSMLSEPDSLHPGRVRMLAGQNLSRMLFDGLTRYNPRDEVELSMARGVEISSDCTHFIFHLKEAYWTSGDKVTAHDFEYAWKKNLSMHSVSENAFLLFGIKNAKHAKCGLVTLEEVGVKALTESCLEVYLEAPNPDFLSLLGLPVFFPVNERVEKENPRWAEKVETFVSNGPFQIQKWQRENEIHLIKNSSYWDKDQVKLSDIDIAFIDDTTELALFEKGQLDWAGSPNSQISLDALPTLVKKKLMQKKPLAGTCFLRVNTKNPKFANADFRKALFLSLKRDWMLKNITYGSLDEAITLVPQSMELSNATNFQENLAEAQQLLSQAFPAGKPKITLQYTHNQRTHLLAQEMQQQWQSALGLEVELKVLEFKTHLQSMSHNDYELAIGSWIADVNDPANFLAVFQKNSLSNQTGWSNAEFDNLLAESSQAVDKNLKKNLLARCESILLQEMPIIPLFHYNMLFVKNERLHNVGLNDLGVMDVKWAYFE